MFHSLRTFTCLLFLSSILYHSGFCAVVSWGERCQFTAECGDHRLVCEEMTVRNTTERICVCDKFHEWNGSFSGCLLKYKTEDILGMLQEKYNISSKIEYEANLIFHAQIAAGMLVMVVGLVCSITVAAYCYRMWKQDTDLDDIVKRMESQKVKNQPTTSQAGR